VQSKAKQAGFTLLEIAIVLIVTGLLLGGILKSQEMITQARIKNVVNDFNGITAAYIAYQDRYSAVPGDDNLAATRWADPNLPGGPKNGNGSGLIGGKYMASPPADLLAATVDDTAGESNNFWWHLRLAGFVAGATSGRGAWSQPVNAVGGLLGVQNGSPGTGAAAPRLAGLVLCSANVPDKIARAVDTQLDDHLSSTGQMFAYPQGSESNPDIDGAIPIYAATAYVETGSNQYVICKRI
jgi:prepilin-type N-terminal cleavage/methylation domain-containing protein